MPVDAARQQAMGAELAELYEALWQEVAWLYAKWGQYVALFGTKSERIDLLNKASPFFFKLVQDALWEDSVLHIARLTDRKETSRKANLSIRQFENLAIDPLISGKIEDLIAVCMDKSKFARDWRNRHIAHRDLARAISEHAEPLMPASRAMVKEVLEALSNLLNAFAQHYLDTTTLFDAGTFSGDAQSLLYVLDDGISAGKARSERFKSGKPTPDDLKRRNL